MLRPILALLAILVVAGVLIVRTALQPPAPPTPDSSSFTLSGLTVINPGSSRRTDMTMSVTDGVISAFGAAASGGQQELEELVEYQGKYVLPGLIDLHTHLPTDNALELAQYFALLYLAHGVTSVRDAGDPDGTAVAGMREGIEGGEFPGPRIFACGPFVAGGEARWANTILLDDPADAEDVVVKLKQDGFDCIKSYDGLTIQTLAALKDAAARHDMPIIGHLPTDLPFEIGLVPNVQHYFGVPPPESLERDHVLNRAIDWQAVDQARMDVIVDAALRHRIVNTPTLISTQRLLLYKNFRKTRSDAAVALMPRLYRDVVWHPEHGLAYYRNIGPEELKRIRKAFAKKIELTRRLYVAGAELQIGTDVQQPFVVPGVSVHQEMRLFTEASIPVQKVWAIATRDAGKALGVDKLGTLQVGAPADFLVFGRDPSGDLSALESLEAVVASGNLYKKADLDAAVAEHQKHFSGRIFDTVSVTAAKLLLARTVKRSN